MARVFRFGKLRVATLAALFLAGVALPQLVRAQAKAIAWSAQEKPIASRVAGLRSLPDEVRGRTTRDLAIRIRQLPAAANKVQLAFELASLSTEGDFGHETLQEVASTLAAALQERPPRTKAGEIAPTYIELAQLVRYEHVQVSLTDAQFAAALSKMDADDARRQDADFALKDLEGKTWSRKALAGKVVLVNFWATWCPPCNKEIPDLETLYERFQGQGFVILAISDESASAVKPFIAKRNVTYPVLLDSERKANELFQVEGIPKSFVYDRGGKLVAQSIDMRTQKQFLEMLAQADLH
jgi:peroxiredoxin